MQAAVQRRSTTTHRQQLCGVATARPVARRAVLAGFQKEQQAHVKALEHQQLLPYLLWDKALKLSAVWDSRAPLASEQLQALQQHALDATLVTLDSSMAGLRGQQLTTLTIVCRPDAGDQVAAALLQLTPATHIQATPIELSLLPQHTVPVTTPQFGSINVHLSLAGSTVSKATPDWQQCESAAASAAGGAVDAADVAAAAVQALHAGLDDGSIDLSRDMGFLF